MSLLGAVTTLLRERGTAFALIGAGALAVHGISRSTRDLDLLVVERGCLASEAWEPLRAQGIEVAVHPGDADDPLAGVVRLRTDLEGPVDVVVGRHAWQTEALGRALSAEIDGVRLPVVQPSDLVLLKLYAGGPQDAWDIAQLLAGSGGPALAAEVDRHLAALPSAAGALWSRLRQP